MIESCHQFYMPNKMKILKKLEFVTEYARACSYAYGLVLHKHMWLLSNHCFLDLSQITRYFLSYYLSIQNLKVHVS